MTRRKAIGLLIIFSLFGLPAANAQTVQKAATGSIAGQIRIGERGAAGVVVALTSAEARGNAPGPPRPVAGANPESSARATTDGDGRYQINQVAAGSFRVTALAPGYVVSGSTRALQIAEGQSVNNVDFTLTKGGVITGRVTGRGDRPVIGEPVTLTPLDSNGQPARFPAAAAMNFRTDDRGVYRVYGLATGRYVVSVGRGEGRGGGPGRADVFAGGRGGSSTTWQRTYYPDVLEAAQATVVAVEAGNEVTGIDIRMNSRDSYAISGRVVDAETGSPIAAVLIGHGRTGGAGGGGGNRGDRQLVTGGNTDGMSNAEGEFRIEGVTPGKYAVYVAQDRAMGQSEFYSDPVPVEVSAQDVSGIEVRLHRGASIIGAIVFENAGDPGALASLPNFVVSASSRGGGRGGGGMNNASSQVAANGGFRIAGLSPGLVNLNVSDRRSPGPGSGLTIMRIERDGADLRAGLRVEPGEQVTGVRIIVAYGNSTLRGVVQVQGGALPPQLRLTVLARRLDASASAGGRGSFPAQVEASGRFQIDRLVPGAYEVTVQAMGLGRPGSNSSGAKQTVNLGSGVQNVVIPLDLAALVNQQNPNAGANNGGRRRGGRP